MFGKILNVFSKILNVFSTILNVFSKILNVFSKILNMFFSCDYCVGLYIIESALSSTVWRFFFEDNKFREFRGKICNS